MLSRNKVLTAIVVLVLGWLGLKSFTGSETEESVQAAKDTAVSQTATAVKVAEESTTTAADAVATTVESSSDVVNTTVETAKDEVAQVTTTIAETAENAAAPSEGGKADGSAVSPADGDVANAATETTELATDATQATEPKTGQLPHDPKTGATIYASGTESQDGETVEKSTRFKFDPKTGATIYEQ